MKYQKIFTAIYAVVVAVMLIPALMQLANKPVLVLGWPAFFMWLIVWTLVGVAAMLVNYKLDCKADAERKKGKKK